MMNKFIKTDQLFVITVSLCITVVCGGVLDYTNTPGRWTKPCGVPFQMTSNPSYEEQVSRNYVLATFISLEESILQSTPLIAALATERLQNPEDLMDLLRNATHSGLPQDINWETNTSLRNMTSSFIDDFAMLSVFAAFLEKTKWEEKDFHHGDYVSMYESLEDRHYSAMCNLQKLIASLNGTIDAFIKRDDVIPSDFHEESKLSRSMRDYVTVKEAENFYADLMSKYDAIIL